MSVKPVDALMKDTNPHSPYSPRPSLPPLHKIHTVDGIFSRVDSAADTLVSMSSVDICGEHITDMQAGYEGCAANSAAGVTETDTSTGHAAGTPSGGASPTATASDRRRGGDGVLKVREHPLDGPYVSGTHHVSIKSSEEAVRALQAAHARHLVSGSGHLVAVLELRHKAAYAERKGEREKVGAVARIVRLYMVQLAHVPVDTPPPPPAAAAAASSSTQSLRRSLHTLGQVLSSLGRADGALKQALPYRDSTLTWLLKDALAGQGGLVSVLATLSPTESCYEESSATTKQVAQWAPHDLQAPRTIQLGGGCGGAASQASSGGKGSGSSGRSGGDKGIQGREWELAQCATSPGGTAISFQSAIEKLHEGLGARTGSAASRTLLQAVVSDPQQKAGKAGRGASSSGSAASRWTSQYQPPPVPPAAAAAAAVTTPPPHSGNSSPGTHIALGDVGGLEGMREKCRTLQAALLETQLELDCARTDRDTLQAELATVRAGLVHASQLAASPKGQPTAQQARRAGLQQSAEAEQVAAASSAQLEASQRELRSVKSILLRKEEALESLAEDLRCEQEGRQRMEQAAEATVRECLQRFGDMQARISELEEAEARALIHANDASVTVRTLRDAVTGQVQSAVQVSDSLEQQLLAEREKMGSTSLEMQALQQQVQEAHAANAVIKEERQALRTALAAAEEIHHIELERDRKQVTEALETQLRESALSAERTRAELSSLQEQHSTLQRDIALKEDSLHNLLVSGGSSLQSKTEDTRQLMQTVASLREGMASLPLVHAELAEEKARRKEDGEKAQGLLRRQMVALQDLTGKVDYWQALAKKQRQYIETVEAAYSEATAAQQVPCTAVQEAHELARQWQLRAEEAEAALQVAVAVEDSAASGKKGDTVSEETRRRLTEAEAEVQQQRQEATAAQAAMQEEYATLWVAVQDLNQLDAHKEAAIRTLVQDQQHGRKKLLEAQTAYAALQRELTAIDDELLDAARAEGLEDVAGRIVRLRENVREPVYSRAQQRLQTIGAAELSLQPQQPLRLQQLNTSAAALLAQRTVQQQAQRQHQQHPPRSRSPLPDKHVGSHNGSQSLRESQDSGMSTRSPLAMFSHAKAQQDELREQDLCRTLDDINALLERSPPRNKILRHTTTPPRLPGSVQSASSSRSGGNRR